MTSVLTLPSYMTGYLHELGNSTGVYSYVSKPTTLVTNRPKFRTETIKDLNLSPNLTFNRKIVRGNTYSGLRTHILNINNKRESAGDGSFIRRRDPNNASFPKKDPDKRFLQNKLSRIKNGFPGSRFANSSALAGSHPTASPRAILANASSGAPGVSLTNASAGDPLNNASLETKAPSSLPNGFPGTRLANGFPGARIGNGFPGARLSDGSSSRFQNSGGVALGTRPVPPLPRKRMNLKNDKWLKELNNRVQKTDATVQTEDSVSPPSSPLRQQSNQSVDKETQIYPGDEDLFDFDSEVASILEAIVGRTLEQSLMEVTEEEELAALRRQKQSHIESMKSLKMQPSPAATIIDGDFIRAATAREIYN